MPPAYELISGDLNAGIILICDHASNTLPESYGTLGLSREQLARHIGYDIGAAGVTRALAGRLGVPAVMSCFSRLLIDPNRGMDDPTLIMQLSDGAVVPGNRHLSGEEIERRINTYYKPYHEAIDRLIEKASSGDRAPILVSIHSFTPVWKERPRPWHISILWDKDGRLPRPLLEELGREEAIVVGENEPYTGELMGDCMYQHGTARGLAHALLEIRQDLIGDEAGQAAYAERIERALTAVLERPELVESLRQYRHFIPASAPGYRAAPGQILDTPQD